MSKTVKQVTKIKLVDGGLKGLEVTYIHPQEKDNMIWSNEHIEKRKHPIHKDLNKVIGDLRNFLLDVCGYYNETTSVMHKDYLIEECNVTEVSIGGSDSFKISGELRVRGDKFIKIATPEVEIADGYEHFDTVQNIIKAAVLETHEYMAGKKKLDEADYLKMFAKRKGDDVLIKEMKDMSKKELKDKCTEMLEKMGAIVLMDEEQEGQLELEPVSTDILQVVEQKGEIIPISIPEPVKIVEKPKIAGAIQTPAF
jgi:hypothetical protein